MQIGKEWKRAIKDSILSRGDLCRCGKEAMGVTCEDVIWWAICSECRHHKRERARRIVLKPGAHKATLWKKIEELTRDLNEAKAMIKELKYGK